MADEHQFCTFFLDGQYFGIDVLKVQEIIRFQEMTRVPLAPPTIQGLINLRGQIVTAIDMRRRLALRPRPEGQVPMNVVIRSEEGAVSLLVWMWITNMALLLGMELKAEATPTCTTPGWTTPPPSLTASGRELVALSIERC